MRLPRTARFDDEVPDARPDDEVGAEAVRERVAAGGAHEGAAERAVPAEQGVR
jgi:hypothetical protein